MASLWQPEKMQAQRHARPDAIASPAARQDHKAARQAPGRQRANLLCHAIRHPIGSAPRPSHAVRQRGAPNRAREARYGPGTRRRRNARARPGEGYPAAPPTGGAALRSARIWPLGIMQQNRSPSRMAPGASVSASERVRPGDTWEGSLRAAAPVPRQFSGISTLNGNPTASGPGGKTTQHRGSAAGEVFLLMPP